ncbi:hypothetical protein EAI28_00870 [Faecalicatena contorta]|nr:hypothetical protein [Faecalicatena contorta]
MEEMFPAMWKCLQIQENVGGDLFSIRFIQSYPVNYEELIDYGNEEKNENARPELTEQVTDMENYDVVFLGFPNWWYSVPMPVLTFLDEHDLARKKIVLFCSHGTGGLSGSVQDITAELPDDCETEENVIGVYRDDIPGTQTEIQG